MKIKLRGLKEGEHSFSFVESAPVYALDPERFAGGINSTAAVDVQGYNYYIKIATDLGVNLQCDRCLDPFTRQLRVETRVIYTEDPSLDPEHEQEGLYLLPANDDTADLTEDVRQSILLGMPVKVLCKESCGGLCPQCGVNRNREKCSCVAKTDDSRWEALKNIKMN